MNKKTLKKLKRKQKALKLRKSNLNIKEIAKRIGVSQTTIYRYFQEDYDSYVTIRELHTP
jgi:transposase